MRNDLKKPIIIVVGQSPDLATGQSKMIGLLLKSHFEHIRLYYVPMNFSTKTDEIGKASIKKIIHLVKLVVNISSTAVRFKYSGYRPILYFPPAGPNLTPILRDIVILILCRPLFYRTIFHFHAAGLTSFRSHIPKILRPLFDLAYRKPALAIATATSGLTDGTYLNATNNIVIHNGIEDLQQPIRKREATVPRILFVGLLKEDKGILVLIKALSILKSREIIFETWFIGGFTDRATEQQTHDAIRLANLTAQIKFLGELKHDERLLQVFVEADIFCFPSFYASESFGIVCVEAMRASLPVVATNWRGIPDIVKHNVTGLIVPPKSPEPLADALEKLIKQPELREKFGNAGRARFLSCFTSDHFCKQMEKAFIQISQ